MTLKQLLLLFAMLPACGPVAASSVASTTAGDTAASAARWADTVVERADVSATPINGGINPTFFGYRIDARIMTGSNPCQARGVQARLHKVKDGDVIYVTPQLSVPTGAGVRVCTREFMPQYANVSLDVRADRSRVRAIRVRNVGAVDQTVAVEELGKATVEVGVRGVTFTPVNAGINPDAFAVKITGTVELGTNTCTAEGVRAWFQETVSGREIHLKVLRDETPNLGRICTKEYRPVRVELSTTVRGSRSKVDKVVVHHAGGRDEVAVYGVN
jgi:hypothetical protein